MDGRNLFVMFVYRTEGRGIIMNSTVLENFPLDRLATKADMEQVKEALVRVCTAAEVEVAKEDGSGPAAGAGGPRRPEEVKNMAVMDWRWMDRPVTAKARPHRRDVRV